MKMKCSVKRIQSNDERLYYDGASTLFFCCQHKQRFL